MTDFDWELWWSNTYEWLYRWGDGDCDQVCEILIEEFGDGASDGFVDWLASEYPRAWSVWAGLPNG